MMRVAGILIFTAVCVAIAGASAIPGALVLYGVLWMATKF